MATKDGNLYFKDKQNGFVDSISDYQYSNLKLNNQNQECETEEIFRPKNLRFDNKKIQNHDFSQSNRSQKHSNSWNKSSKSSYCFNFGRDLKENDEIKKVKGINNSTLSLNIAAYENSIESDATDSEGIKRKSLKVKGAKTGLNKKWGISNHFDSESIIQNPFEFPRQQDDQASRPEIMQFRASQRMRNRNRMDSNNSGQRFWQIDTFWPLKVLSFFGIAAYNSCVLSPADICFNLRHSALLEEKIKSNEFVLEPSQTYIIKERYCIMIDIFKHQLCSTQNLTTVPNDLCLAQSREVTAMFSQLFLAIFIDFFHMIVLYRGIQHLTPTQLAIPVVQISMLASVCITLTGEGLRWPTKWINANYDRSAIPSNPYKVWLLWFGFILIFMKMLEFIVLYRAFKRNKNGNPKIIQLDSNKNNNSQ